MIGRCGSRGGPARCSTCRTDWPSTDYPWVSCVRCSASPQSSPAGCESFRERLWIAKLGIGELPMAAEEIKPVSQWMTECGLDLPALVAASRLDSRVAEAIVAGRYTPSPEQR